VTNKTHNTQQHMYTHFLCFYHAAQPCGYSPSTAFPPVQPDEKDDKMKKILTASHWRTGGDHQDVLVLRGWRLFSRTWNLITSPWKKQLTWLRIVHSGDWCLCLVLRTASGPCQNRRRRRRSHQLV